MSALAGHRHRHDRAREHASTSRRRTPTPTRRRRSPRRRPPPTARSASTSRSPAARPSSTSSPSARAAATAHAKRTVLFDFVPGTLLLDVADPDGDDNGPGNYAYPTSDELPRRAPSTSSGSRSTTPAPNVIFRLQTRDLSQTFGSPLGAQLVDVYVHDPGRRPRPRPPPRSRSATSRSRRRRVEPADRGAGLRPALRRRRRQPRSGRSSISANPISRFITFSVPKASLGHARPGLGLHRRAHRPGRLQPGPGPRLPPTPQDFQFGVCATASADPHCTFDPGTRAEGGRRDHAARRPAVDELDYTLGPGRAHRRSAPLRPQRAIEPARELPECR